MPPVKRLHRPRFWRAKVFTGGICLALFAYSVSDYAQFERIAVHVTGKVLKIRSESHATGRRGNRVVIDRPEVRFTVPGSAREVTATAKVMSRREFTPGEAVELEMDPARPEDTVRVAGGLSLLDWSFGVVGFTLVGFGLAEWWRWRQAAKAATAPKAAVGIAAGAAGQPAGDSV